MLHDELGLADVRYGCGEGVCGTCTVLLDGEPVNGCLILAVQAAGHQVTTLRGLMGPGEACTRCRSASCAAAPRSAASAPPA